MMLGARAGAWANRGGGVPTARDYVQDGLVAMWDGIENAGWGVHNPNATEWKDLVGGNDVSLIGNSSQIDIQDKYIHFTEGGYGIGEGKFDMTNLTGATISFVCEFDNNALNAIGWSYAGAKKTRFAPYYESGGWNFPISSAPVRLSYASYGLHRYDFVCEASSISLYVDGSFEDRKSQSNQFGMCANRFRVMAYGSTSDTVFKTFNGKAFNIMVYDKAISAAEIAANYAIDKARFNLP